MVKANKEKRNQDVLTTNQMNDINTKLLNDENIIKINDLGSKYVTIYGPYGYPSLDVYIY